MNGWMRAGMVAFFLLVTGAWHDAHAQGTSRYQAEIFTSYQLRSDIQYGQSITAGGSTKILTLDVYTGTGDTATVRPLVIFIHGGGFKGGDKVSNFGTRVCGGLARRGYVVASINYRVSSSIPNDTVHFEAMLRALQDGKGAVRFFRRYATEYGIDTAQIFATGSSAGSITALHMAYLDSAELPSYVTLANVGGTFEGTSGNPGYSSRIQGVISNWGAIADYRWIAQDDVPVFCVHGTADATVPYDSSFADGPFKYGSTIIYQRAQDLGISAGLRLFLNTGHTLDNNATKQDSAYRDFSAWLYTILAGQPETSVPRGENALPSAPLLHPNYPNPFNPTTTLEYDLPESGHVSLELFDSTGRPVSTLVEGRQTAGRHRVRLDASSLASGVYFCRLLALGRAEVRRMVLLR